MADITTMARTAMMLSGGRSAARSNRAQSDGSLQYQYFQNETVAYAQQMGAYASNVFKADCQGIDPNDFFKWRKIQLRSIRAAQAQTGSTMPGDWQRIYIINPANFTYLPQGAMLKYADNTWIVYKDKNIAAVHGSSIVRRCNAVVNVLDWYGNIVHIPISYAKMETLGNAPHTTENTITSKNYIACICQINEYTSAFSENTRILLGKTAYAMRGLDDFTREFTDDPDSCHLLSFTIERVEVQPHDNVKLGVADYGGFSWDLSITWNNSMIKGSTQTVKVKSLRNGTDADGNAEHPVSYIFTSSDENVLTVDEDGHVTAVSEGTAEITVALAQNPSITKTVAVEVPAAESEYVAFTTTLPKVLHEGEVILIGAAFFHDGIATNWPVEFTFSGTEKSAYGFAKYTEGGDAMAGSSALSGELLSGFAEPDNVFALTAYHATQKPLTVTIESQGHTASAEIYLTT